MLALYVSGFACATTELAPGSEKPVPHIALLLPLKSAIFKSAAEAVQQGFQAAAELEIQLPERLPVRVYSCFDESKDIVALYRQAVAGGARAVVGPLTRSGVSTLAAEQNIPVPTLALNVAEEKSAGQLYFFGMSAEAEARQVAQLAMQQGLRQAFAITTHAQLSKRLQFAFEEEWNRLGGALLHEIEFNGDYSVFAGITDMPDTAVFLAVEAEKARLVRPYLPNKLPIYGTSQIFVGNDNTLTNFDLNSIRFVDMPWLLQADHPAVMIYPRPAQTLSADNERLYALGIDAFRLIQLLLAGKIDDALPLDGVSGHIKLNGHIFQRVPIPAVFVQGHAQTRNGHAAPALQVIPDYAIGKP
ncbi:MAG: penicillin-binding protein activator [Nitrosomonadales bacterium]|nr:penicillin-binding protein activator [Nitrosomonadales bacterium]